jgi:thiol-disulfide isomerase/thioredoxin
MAAISGAGRAWPCTVQEKGGRVSQFPPHSDDVAVSPQGPIASSVTAQNLWRAVIWLGGAVAVGVLFALLLAPRPLTHAGSSGQGPQIGPDIGDLAPDFTLNNLHGQPVSLHGFRGRPVLLHLWAVGCPACQEEAPQFTRAIQALGNNAPVVLAVDDWGEGADLVQPYVQQTGLPGTVLLDPLDFWGHADVSFRQRYHVQGIPTSIYIDANGVIRQRTIGVETVQDIIQSVQSIQSR